MLQGSSYFKTNSMSSVPHEHWLLLGWVRKDESGLAPLTLCSDPFITQKAWKTTRMQPLSSGINVGHWKIGVLGNAVPFVSCRRALNFHSQQAFFPPRLPKPRRCKAYLNTLTYKSWKRNFRNSPKIHYNVYRLTDIDILSSFECTCPNVNDIFNISARFIKHQIA